MKQISTPENKKEVARQVAAKHSTHLDMATHRYMELTGLLEKAPKEFQYKIKHHFDDLHLNFKQVTREDPSFTLDDDCYSYPWKVTNAVPFKQAQKEMLSVLEGYKHPVKNALIEHEIFFGDNGFRFEKVLRSPDWVKDSKSLLEVPKPLREKIRTYVNEAEDVKRYYKDCRKELTRLREMIAHATDEYKPRPGNDTSAKRNARVVPALGLSPGKKGRVKTIDHDGAYCRYVQLVRHQGESQQEAIKVLRKAFDYQSNDTTIKHLHDSLLKVKEWWRTVEREKPPGLKEYWIGLVPDRRK